MRYRYRVRGIYATAVAKLLLDNGHELVDLSKQLADRFGLDQRADVPPDATVKVSDDDPDTLVIVGKSEAVGEAFEILASSIPFSSTIFELYGPSTSARAKIVGVENGRCVAETSFGRGVLLTDRCDVGTELWVNVAKAPSRRGEPYVFRRGLAIVMDTVTLIRDGGRISFSEHIRSWERKAELMALSQDVARRGISVRWRSAARSAPLEKLGEDLRKGVELLEAVEKEGRDVVIGESIAFVTLSSLSKRFLDDVRRRVLPTAPRHHELKTRWDSSIVDVLDALSSEIPEDVMDRAIERLCLDYVVSRGSAMLIHRKPGEEVVRIGPAEVLGYGEHELLGRYLVLKRVAKSDGVYDGLGVEKRAGDIMLSIVPTRRWFLVHSYFSSEGSPKGLYINVNTPPELTPSGDVSYLDLFVDVVVRDGEVRVVDEDQLAKALDEGFVPPDAASIATEVVEELKSGKLVEELRSIAKEWLARALQPSSAQQRTTAA